MLHYTFFFELYHVSCWLHKLAVVGDTVHHQNRMSAYSERDSRRRVMKRVLYIFHSPEEEEESCSFHVWISHCYIVCCIAISRLISLYNHAMYQQQRESTRAPQSRSFSSFCLIKRSVAMSAGVCVRDDLFACTYNVIFRYFNDRWMI